MKSKKMEGGAFMNEEDVVVSVSGDHDPYILDTVSSGDPADRVQSSISVSGGDPVVGAGSPSQSGSLISAADYSEQLSGISSQIAGLNALVFLIFVFLLLSWTEKKISVLVNRFTRERK